MGIWTRADRQSRWWDVLNAVIDNQAGLNGAAAARPNRHVWYDQDWTEILRNTVAGGKHRAVLLSTTAPTATPSGANAVIMETDAGISIGAGKGLRLYEAGGTDYAEVTSADGGVILGGSGAEAGAITLPEIATPAAPGAAKQKFYARTGLLARETSAGVESRLLDASQFTAPGQLIWGSAANVSATLAAGTAGQVLHGGPVLTWSQIIPSTDIAADAYVALRDTTNQSCGGGAITDLTWNTEDVDLLGMHVAASATCTIPTGYGGIWIASVVAAWASGGTGTRQLQIYLNGAPVAASAQAPMTAVGFTSCLAVFQAAAASVVKVIAYQDTGGAINILGTAGAGSTFKMARVGS